MPAFKFKVGDHVRMTEEGLECLESDLSSQLSDGDITKKHYGEVYSAIEACVDGSFTVSAIDEEGDGYLLKAGETELPFCVQEEDLVSADS